MKLYNVPRNTKIRLINDANVPPIHRDVVEGEVLLFSHVDGMYSYCTDSKGEVVHLSVMTSVEIVEESDD